MIHGFFALSLAGFVILFLNNQEQPHMLFSNEIFGGLLIGFASAIPLLFEGRIAGISGYAG